VGANLWIFQIGLVQIGATQTESSARKNPE